MTWYYRRVHANSYTESISPTSVFRLTYGEMSVNREDPALSKRENAEICQRESADPDKNSVVRFSDELIEIANGIRGIGQSRISIIESPTETNPRHCNIKWEPNDKVLKRLIREAAHIHSEYLEVIIDVKKR